MVALSLPDAAKSPAGLANHFAPRWDDMRVKHTWGSIPEKWERYRHPPAGALKPHHENALIDSLL